MTNRAVNGLCTSKPCLRSLAQACDFFRQARRRLATSGLRASSLDPASAEVRSAQNYCSNLLRKYDSPSFTLQYFIKPHMLPAYLAIRAFNIEVARVPDVVSNANVGSFRMQFWRDTINSTFDHQPPAEPVAILLASVLTNPNYKLNKSWFLKLISARQRLLTHPGYTSLAGLEMYAENTYSTLLYLTLSALPLKSLTMDHLASHVGKAAGICAVLRGFPLVAFPDPPPQVANAAGKTAQLPPTSRQGVITLPVEVMSQTGVREEDVFRNGPTATGLRDAAFSVATRASDHLITARSMLESIKKAEDPGHEYEHEHDEGHNYGKYGTGVRLSGERRRDEYEKGFSTLMGPAVSTQLWLDRLQKCDFNLFDPSLRRPDWKLPFVAWWKNRNGQI